MFKREQTWKSRKHLWRNRRRVAMSAPTRMRKTSHFYATVNFDVNVSSSSLMCVYVCVYVYIYIIYIYVCVCTHTYTHIYIFSRKCVYFILKLVTKESRINKRNHIDKLVEKSKDSCAISSRLRVTE